MDDNDRQFEYKNFNFDSITDASKELVAAPGVGKRLVLKRLQVGINADMTAFAWKVLSAATLKFGEWDAVGPDIYAKDIHIECGVNEALNFAAAVTGGTYSVYGEYQIRT